MLHGVPQGSILGHLYSIFHKLYINDLPLYSSAQINLHVDDTIVTASADMKDSATLHLTLSVSKIQLWAVASKLPLNEDKTIVLMITGKRHL